MKEFYGTKGIWTVNPKNEIEMINIKGKVLQKYIPKIPRDMIDKSKANSKLIAAAPELLEALQYMLAKFSHINIAPEAVEKAKKAIDKAL